ncbi:MAG: bifunctional phosphopantothenoylcysteine decarboxylase/phosphopantothenate--cysteine ligase CoaBC [Nitrospirae bacterium]|nr:bifunctional phosphopantothenoylcysteine decarboxylase/phosphopantothenate--cysteine ligase CoaBC [Nitrospirota bacterium]
MTGARFHGVRLLLGVCGSIAAYKSVYLVRRLTEQGATVHVAMTGAATRFVTPLTFETVSGNPVMTDLFSGPPNRHIELAEAVDAALVAPATANTLARHAAGIADDALGTLLLALRGPLLVAPAMDGGMWDHPATRANVDTLQARGVAFVGPASGPLASGLEGVGRVAEVPEILDALEAMLADVRVAASMAGEHVLVTAGATREHLDPVRFLSNPSTGRMGFAVAAEAARRGARVTLVAGPSELPTPPGCTRLDVTSAADMADAVRAHVGGASMLVMCAAVSDFRPAVRHPHKVKKDAGEGHVALERTEDILKSLAGRTPEGLVKVGFAAETEDLLAHARRKLVEKDLDLIVANDVTQPGAGFRVATNRATLIGRDGSEQALDILPKARLAALILDRAVALRQSVRPAR